MMYVAALFLLIALPNLIRSIPIDNGVEGDPEVECAADSITVNFNTRNEFQGHVYVKGRFAEQDCRSDEGGRRVAGIKLAFTACGTKRERSLTPKGVTVSNTVVITFHPQFLTKVDRAYTVQCFYMEADKTVSQELEVSEITTAFQTQVVPMPLCRYEILDGSPTGEPIKFAVIGQQVYHKWTCETEAVDIFCALIHSCFVDDGAGNNVQLLNEQGCALDKFLLNNLEYQTDLMAGHEAHVFKYADKPALFFQCQISITIKEPGQDCNRAECPEPGGPGAEPGGGSAGTGGTRPPPTGPPPTGPPESSPPASTRAASSPGTGGTAGSPSVRPTSPAPPPGSSLPPAPAVNRAEAASRRDSVQFPFRFRYVRAAGDIEARKRSTASASDPVGTWDVAAQPVTALDIDEDKDGLPLSLKRLRDSNSSFPFQQPIGEDSYCFSPVSFGLLLSLVVVSLLTGAMVIFSCLRRTGKL